MSYQTLIIPLFYKATTKQKHDGCLHRIYSGYSVYRIYSDYSIYSGYSGYRGNQQEKGLPLNQRSNPKHVSML